MRYDIVLIFSTMLIFGMFIFLKGFQENLDVISIILIFIEFVTFFISFMLISVFISNFINWIFNNMTGD